MSKKSTNAAELPPPMRSTLVAPGLPEPLVRGSGKPLILQTNTALEIEPAKYAAMIINIVTITVFKLVSLLFLGYHRACFY
jgi:hypothetical protein